ncbi:hypothetical protein ACIA5C_29825 [Actinoplanes sp. NPDC051343]|uniref:hypothetical protein n=1 Tax=Actinoplanes sp. NPDC051343 TaxID=3363906 RepID=UPI0037A13155
MSDPRRLQASAVLAARWDWAGGEGGGQRSGQGEQAADRGGEGRRDIARAVDDVRLGEPRCGITLRNNTRLD